MVRLASIIAGLLAACASDPVEAPPPPIVGEPHELTTHDVSVLFPIDGVDALWPASLTGRGGPLVPSQIYNAIGRSVVKDLDDADEYAAMRVVAVRFDPCFRHDLSGAPCQPQVRLVFQAIDVEAGRALDGALHALYNLDEPSFAALVTELRALTAAAPEQADASRALGVSPALTAQGLDGVYGQNLRALIRRYAGAETLARLTFMTRTSTRSGQWEFGGRAVRAFPDTGFDAPGPLEIGALGMSVELQTVTSEIAAAGYGYKVEPGFADLAGAPAAVSAKVAALATDQRDAVYRWMLRQGDPGSTTPDSTDCASCHVAERARDYFEAAFPDLIDPIEVAQRPQFQAGALANPDNLRAFGYFEATPVVVLRTAQESRAVVAALALFPRP